MCNKTRRFDMWMIMIFSLMNDGSIEKSKYSATIYKSEYTCKSICLLTKNVRHIKKSKDVKFNTLKCVDLTEDM